uniref:Ig-like domain-containing protein n=1 Tax=Ciona intestinalis TaxID=7719 RepID=H2Y0E5_CIOIN
MPRTTKSVWAQTIYNPFKRFILSACYCVSTSPCTNNNNTCTSTCGFNNDTTTHRTHTSTKTHAHPHVAATTTTTTTTVATTTKSTIVKPHHVEKHTYSKGSSITLQCSSTMFPDSNWFHKKKQYTKGVIGTNNSLTLKGLTSSSSGLYCCKRDSHNLSCHKLVMQQHKEHHTSPVVYVIVVFFVLLVVFGAGFCFWKRIRKARRESYGLLSDQHAFHPSVDGLSHNNDPRTAL